MRTPATPPSAALWLLRLALSEDDYETTAGDLEEMFVADVVPRLGTRRARRWYWRQAASILSRSSRIDVTSCGMSRV